MRAIQMIHSEITPFETQYISQDHLDLEDPKSFFLGGVHNTNCNGYATVWSNETLSVNSASGISYHGGRLGGNNGNGRSLPSKIQPCIRGGITIIMSNLLSFFSLAAGESLKCIDAKVLALTNETRAPGMGPAVLVYFNSSQGMMVNCMYRHDWATGCLDIQSNIILVFL